MDSNYKLRLEDIRPGQEVSCYISDQYCENAKIQVENEHVYICQNEMQGHSCADQLGYCYSWSIGLIGSIHDDGISIEHFFNRQEAKDVQLLTREWDPEVNVTIKNCKKARYPYC